MTLLQLPDIVLLSLSIGLLLLSGCLGTNVGAPLAISRDSRQGEYGKTIFIGPCYTWAQINRSGWLSLTELVQT